MTAIADLKKAELHAHLNGSIDPTVVLDIMAQDGVLLEFPDVSISDLTRSEICAGLAEYLAVWKYLRLIPRSTKSLHCLCASAFQGFFKNNIAYVELRSSLLYLSNLLNLSPPDALGFLIEEINQTAAHFGIEYGLVLTVSRGSNSGESMNSVLAAYSEAGCPKQVVGIDLAGDEDIRVSDELPALFRAAKDRYGFGVTIHAGETGNAESVRTAIVDYAADRIGHGLAAAKEPKIIELILRAGVCLEVCPISSRLTRSVSSGEEHPLLTFADAGVPFVICSDNPGLHRKGLNEDYREALSEGLPASYLIEQYDLAMRHAFRR